MKTLTILLQQDPIQSTLHIAKGISDYGMTQMMAALMFVITGVVVFILVRQYNASNRTNENISSVLLEIGTSLKNLNIKIDEMKDLLIAETYNQAKTVIKYILAYNKYQSLVFLGDTKDSDDLDNRDAVERKLRLFLENLHNRRNTDLDYFVYKGRKLSTFTNPAWIDGLFEYLLECIYDGRPYSRDAYIFLFDNFYEKMEVECLENLRI